jgi:hypothetical protein
MEKRAHVVVGARHAEAAAKALGGGVAADQGAYPGAIDPADGAQVDDEIAVAAGEQRLRRPLERLRGVPFDERLIRREDQVCPPASPLLRRVFRDGCIRD